MAAFKYTEGQLQHAFWKRVQRSMEFEGYPVSDEQIRKTLCESEGSGRRKQLVELKAKARAEGRSFLEVMKEATAKGEFPL